MKAKYKNEVFDALNLPENPDDWTDEQCLQVKALHWTEKPTNYFLYEEYDDAINAMYADILHNSPLDRFVMMIHDMERDGIEVDEDHIKGCCIELAKYLRTLRDYADNHIL